MHINQKSLIAILSIVVIVLIGTISYFAIIKVETQINSTAEIVKTYENEVYGYQIQYPSFFMVDDSRLDDVWLSNNTCSSNTKLCILGIDGIQVNVSDNNEGMNTDQYYQNWENTCPKIKKVKIFPLPENFNENELIEAIRCEFDEVPKQAKGGYTYAILNGNKIFNITMYQSDSTLVAFVNGSLLNIAKDTYNPLGDMMMRTFKFTK